MPTNEKESRVQSYLEEATERNAIFSAWTLKWGIHVSPWYNKDKLKFSFVEVGKNGKGNSFDVYVDTIKFLGPCFYKWAKDILSSSRRFENILAQELKAGEKYPKHYKFVTGNKGNKSVGICNSQNGKYCINATASINGKSTSANIPVDFSDLELLAEMFMESYKERLAAVEARRKEVEKTIQNHFNKDEDSSNHTVEDEQEDVQTVEQPELVSMKVSVGSPEKGNGEFVFNGINKETNENITLYVANSTMLGEQKERWNSLAAALKEGHRVVTFIVRPGEKNMIESIA